MKKNRNNEIDAAQAEKIACARKTSIGGQALLEGIMMKGPKMTAMAVRDPNGSIILEKWPTQSANRPKIFKLPIIRGVYGFVESMLSGYKCLMRSAELSGLEELEEELAREKEAKKQAKKNKKKGNAAVRPAGTYATGGGIEGKIITLDPGHGGSDPGAVGARGTLEKDITLDISQRLKKELEKMGATVYMTRNSDTEVAGPGASDVDELQARINVAEKYRSDLFVSVHINSSVNKKVGGFSTYYYPKTKYDAKVAKAIQDNLTENYGRDNLGLREANFYVIKRCSMPATLLELCFISNKKEEKLMRGNWFQTKTAKLIAEGIEKYFK